MSEVPGTPELSPEAWRLYSRYRLGIPLDSHDSRPCPGCGCNMDNFGDHALSCPSLGLYTRHNDLRNELATLCIEAGCRVELEAGPPGQLRRPGDLLVHGLSDSPDAVGIAATHALHPSANLADVQAGSLARKTEQRKIRESSALCRRHGWNFCPFVVEVFGAWGGQARHFLHHLASRLALQQGIPRKEAALSCRGRIAASILLSIGRQLERGFSVTVEVAPSPPAEGCCL